jgi:hypothetical protein
MRRPVPFGASARTFQSASHTVRADASSGSNRLVAMKPSTPSSSSPSLAIT